MHRLVPLHVVCLDHLNQLQGDLERDVNQVVVEDEEGQKLPKESRLVIIRVNRVLPVLLTTSLLNCIANSGDKREKDEDEEEKDDLIVGDHINGGALERGLGGVHQQLGLMPSVDHKASNPSCVSQPCPSQQQLVGRNGLSIPKK